MAGIKVFLRSSSPRADEGKKTTDHRFVVSQATSKSNAEELFVSVLGSPSNGIAQDFMEVMSFNKTKGAAVRRACFLVRAPSELRRRLPPSWTAISLA